MRSGTMAALALLLAAPAATQDDPRAALQAAQNWIYVIQGLEPPMFEALRQASVDIVVIDAISLLGEEDHHDADAAVEVAALKALPGYSLERRLVLAYLDIGQAEEHRSYWQDGWQPGNPDWIAGIDPDGWEGN